VWLKQHEIPFDHCVVEQGNVDTRRSSQMRIRYENRFSLAADNEVSLFVEDELRKAVKLGDICEVVFLIKHPYNRSAPNALPKNVIEVDSWLEIEKFVRANL